MKIDKYKKDKANKYKVIIDGEEITLYDDTIVKYNLLMKKEISNNEYQEMIIFNTELDSYYLSIKYILKKLRSEQEIRAYLKKHDIKDDVIEKTIKRLKDTNYLNDEMFFKAYINDQLNLTNNGPLKIKKNLLFLGFCLDEIEDVLETIENDVWEERIKKYVDKKIRLNHTASKKQMKMKLLIDVTNLGYEKSMASPIIEECDIIDEDILLNEYRRAKRTLSKKYSGYELEEKIREKLYRKGFAYGEIKELNDED